jgi:hypothetical protein
MTEWFELNENERIKTIYSKYKLKDFWDWWSKGSNMLMEVRIKDWQLTKEVSTKFNLPYSYSGVYVYNDILLKNVVAYVRDKATIWFGINPRKKNYTNRGFKSYGGGEQFIDSFNYLFIDIDRLNKGRPATNEEIKNCDILAERIIERLGKEDWNKDYIKICSGNGIQLLISLDIPIKIPLCDFDNATKVYLHNDEFDKVKEIIKNGIGKQIVQFASRFKEELSVDVDKSCFLISNVGALPVSKNYKYNGFSWRGIVDMKKGKNVGLSDYILSKEDDIVKFKQKNVFSSRRQLRQDIIRPGKLAEHKLVKFILENDLPQGMRNNTIWMSLKILLRDSNFNLRSNEFIRVHKQLEDKLGTLTLNLPDKKYKFNESVINNFCVQYFIPPVYTLWPNKHKKLNMMIDNITWDQREVPIREMQLTNEKDIYKDMGICKLMMKEGETSNGDILISFIRTCIKKYGEKETKYYFDYLMKRWLSYD